MLAATIHGSRLVTVDADICPASDAANLERLAGALRELGAELRSEDSLGLVNDGPVAVPFDCTAELLARNELLELLTRSGELDLVFKPAGSSGFAELDGRAVNVVLGGDSVRVASLDDVIRSKEAAGRPKDQRALPLLRQLAFVNDSYSLNKLTLNVGVRFDRYRAFLPEQERPASRFGGAAVQFAAVDEVISFNHLAPRIGATYDIQGNGKTVLKANFGRYYFNTGVGLADSTSLNPGTQFVTHAWTDRNGDRLWQPGEETQPGTPTGLASAIEIDPNLKNSRTDELSAWLERELPGQIGARVGVVWKMDRDGYQTVNKFRPITAWTEPVTVTDIGPDGAANTGDERTIGAFGLPAAVRALGSVSSVYNPAGYENDYRSIELGATKRFTKKWNMVTSFLKTWTQEYGTSYFGTGAGSNGGGGTLFAGFANSTGLPITPNGKQDQSEFSVWTFKIHGTYAPGWGVRLTPIFRAQQGYPYGRVFTAVVNTVTQNFPAEPFDARRIQTHKQLDFRAEKKLTLTGRAKLGLIFDVFNVFNANTETNLNASTGRITISESGAIVPTFGSPTTILPPRIARLSARLEW